MKALVIEDDAQLRRLVETLLTKHGCELVTDLEQAEVAIVDLHLAGASGLDEIRRIRLSGRPCRIVAMSGAFGFGTGIEERAAAAGADVCVAKGDDFVQALHAALES